jgi:hypothetical protein
LKKANFKYGFMRYLAKTYYQHIVRVVLISFSLVTILSVFHYHNYELLGESLVSQHNQSDANSLLLNDDLQIVCTVQFNYTKLHSINFSDLSQKVISSEVRESNYHSPEIYYLLTADKLSHNLRAPPSL